MKTVLGIVVMTAAVTGLYFANDYARDENGRSVLLDATGARASERLGQFETGALSLRVRVPETTSFYTAHAGAVHGLFVLLLVALLALRWVPALRRARIRGTGNAKF